MRFYLICKDEISTDSYTDLTLSQVVNQIIDHLAYGYKIEADKIKEEPEKGKYY